MSHEKGIHLDEDQLLWAVVDVSDLSLEVPKIYLNEVGPWIYYQIFRNAKEHGQANQAKVISRYDASDNSVRYEFHNNGIFPEDLDPEEVFTRGFGLRDVHQVIVEKNRGEINFGSSDLPGYATCVSFKLFYDQ